MKRSYLLILILISLTLSSFGLFFYPVASIALACIGLGVLFSLFVSAEEVNKDLEKEAVPDRSHELVKHSPFPTLKFDTYGETELLNAAAKRLFRNRFQSSTQIKKLIPEIRKYDLDACINQGAIYTCAANFSQQVFQFVFVGSPNSQLGYVYGVDISKERATQSALEESKSFLRTVIDTNPNLIFVKDSAGRFKLANKALAALYGTVPEDMLGKTEAEFNPIVEEVSQYVADDLEVMSTGNDKYIAEEKLTDADGNVRFLQTFKRLLPVANREEKQVLGVASDITDRKQLQDQLLQVQKMDAIGQLAGGIAHDFNNLLSGVLGYASVLKFNHGDRSDVIEIADKIESAGMRAQKLTGQLLGFARRGKHQHVPVDVHDVIDETLALVKRTLESDIKVRVTLQDESLYTVGDPVQIQQIVLNLAINARDSMTESRGGTDGGELKVSTSRIYIDKKHPEVGLRLKQGQYLVIHVADSGCGMDESVQRRMFEPFFTTKEKAKGSGMGLAMVYGIVASHDGGIFVESVVGQGTRFDVYLPIADRSSIEKSNQDLDFVPVGQGKILVVDDHRVTREVTQRMLATLGYSVITAQDGQEALEIFKANPNEIDLLILDLIMPRLGGLQCFRACKELTPNVKAILMTGHGDNNAVQQSLNEGMQGFIQKPFRLHELSEIVSRALIAQMAA